MKKFNKSFGRIISGLLVLVFSITIAPLDFFHDHSNQNTCSDLKTKKDSCKHKLHLTKKSAYCWVCAVHYDKTFTKASSQKQLTVWPVATTFLDTKESIHVIELLYSALRGPPVPNTFS